MDQDQVRPKSKLSDVRLPILKPENYSEWKIKITSLLKAKELYFLIEKPHDNAIKQEDDYIVINEETKSIIYNSLDGKTTNKTGISETAYELWAKITNEFEGSKDDVTGLALSKFMDISKGDHEKLSDFLGRFEIALNQLESTNFFVNFTLIIYILTRTLPMNIKEGIKVWRTMNPDGKINALLSYIRVNYRLSTWFPH